MQATIAKRFTFHAAHQLPHHDGPCRDLHGHTYQLEVAVTGRVKQAYGGSDEGMVCDFAQLKEVYVKHIEPRVEHKFLNESLRMCVPETRVDDSLVSLTTCENIAAWIWSEFDLLVCDPNQLPRRIVTVRLWETPTSYAIVGPHPIRHELP